MHVKIIDNQFIHWLSNGYDSYGYLSDNHDMQISQMITRCLSMDKQVGNIYKMYTTNQ